MENTVLPIVSQDVNKPKIHYHLPTALTSLTGLNKTLKLQFSYFVYFSRLTNVSTLFEVKTKGKSITLDETL